MMRRESRDSGLDPRRGVVLATVDGFFDTWYPRLVRTIRLRLGSTDDAEDVAQEAFVRMLGAEPADPPAWLFTVAGRLASDRRRAYDRHARLAQHASNQAGDDADGSLEDALVAAECVAAVRSVLRTLPGRDQQLLLLHHDGWSYREIALHLAVAPSSVGSLLTRAHRRFLERYETHHGSPAEAAADDRADDRIRA